MHPYSGGSTLASVSRLRGAAGEEEGEREGGKEVGAASPTARNRRRSHCVLVALLSASTRTVLRRVGANSGASARGRVGGGREQGGTPSAKQNGGAGAAPIRRARPPAPSPLARANAIKVERPTQPSREPRKFNHPSPPLFPHPGPARLRLLRRPPVRVVAPVVAQGAGRQSGGGKGGRSAPLNGRKEGTGEERFLIFLFFFFARFRVVRFSS